MHVMKLQIKIKMKMRYFSNYFISNHMLITVNDHIAYCHINNKMVKNGKK